MHRRLIARLDIKNGRVIKGIQFEGLRTLGDPRELMTRYYREGADEILLMDVVASLYEREGLFEIIKQASVETFVPITAGGGVRSLSDAANFFSAGADRVAVNTAALKRPSLIREISQIYGAQAVVVSIEAKEVRAGTWHCFYDSGREDSGITIETWISKLKSEDVGELLVTSVDRDGTRKGPNLELLNRLKGMTEIPMVYSGGVMTKEDVLHALEAGSLEGVAVASALHYGKSTVGDLKSSSAFKNWTFPMGAF